MAPGSSSSSSDPRSPLPLLPLLLCFCSLLTPLNAQSTSPSNDCPPDPLFPFYNASGSVSLPGPKADLQELDSTWTISRYVVDEPAGSQDVGQVWQKLGLQTSPVLNLSDPSRQYTGCIITYTLVNLPDYNTVEKDNGSCADVLSPSCLSALRQHINSNALALSGQAAGYHCDAFTDIGGLTDCEGVFAGVFAAGIMPNNYSAPINNPGCNPGDTNATNGGFYSWDSSVGGVDNLTSYDRAILSPLPVAVAFYDKMSNTSVSNTGNWVDTAVMCIPANETTAGSRNVTTAAADKSATSAAAGTIVAAMCVWELVAGLTLLAILI